MSCPCVATLGTVKACSVCFTLLDMRRRKLPHSRPKNLVTMRFRAWPEISINSVNCAAEAVKREDRTRKVVLPKDKNDDLVITASGWMKREKTNNRNEMSRRDASKVDVRRGG